MWHRINITEKIFVEKNESLILDNTDEVTEMLRGKIFHKIISEISFLISLGFSIIKP